MLISSKKPIITTILKIIGIHFANPEPPPLNKLAILILIFN